MEVAGPLEKEMVTHSSILAWKIPWTAEPGRLPSTGSHLFAASGGHSLAVVCRLLIVMASLVAEHGL